MKKNVYICTVILKVSKQKNNETETILFRHDAAASECSRSSMSSV